MLKACAARGELTYDWCYHCIDEYRKAYRKDSALERRFQPIMVPEPSVKDTVAIV